MSGTGSLLLLAAFGVALLATGVVRKYALRVGLLDEPNVRSSHSVPTPRAGGLAIVATCVSGWISLYFFDLLGSRELLALSIGGLAVAAVGFLDDRSGLDARIRLLVHLLAASLAVYAVGVATGQGAVGVAWWLLLVCGIGWFVNLYNFMDGIDGLACGEAVFLSLAGAGLHAITSGRVDTALAAIVVGGASLGFLWWNWPPARIFMGDVGSGFLGYVLAVVALSSARQNVGALIPWIILAGAFLADSGVTLLRRALRGERIYVAHRTHAYQWLARRWRSHRRVTVVATLINLFWLLPLAWWACREPDVAGWILLIAVTPLVIAAALAGAGRPEVLPPTPA